MGDSATEPRFIETLPRRGYRFIGSVERLDATGEIVGLPASAAALFRSTVFRSTFGIRKYDVSPDGQRFVIAEAVEDAPPPTIRVVQNWAAEFKDIEE